MKLTCHVEHAMYLISTFPDVLLQFLLSGAPARKMRLKTMLDQPDAERIYVKKLAILD